MIPDNLIQEIKEKSNITEVVSEFTTLNKKRNRHVGLCPLHGEKTPSFHILFDEVHFKCFGCGIGGDVFKFLMEQKNISFPEAVQYVAKKYNVPMPQTKLTPQEEEEHKLKESLFIVTDVANDYFQKQLVKSETVKNYLEGRGINKESVAKFQIGFKGRTYLTTYLLKQKYNIEHLKMLSLTSEKNNDSIRNRITFPIQNIYGRIVGFAHREIKKVKGFSKYLNPKGSILYDKKNILYGLNHAYSSIKQTGNCIIVEGYIDVILLHQYGFTNSVALCGTALTNEQASLIKKYCSKVTLMLDSDDSGIKAMDKAIPILLKNSFEVNLVILDNEKDPSDYLSDKDTNFNEILQEKKQSFYEYQSQKINATNDIPIKTKLINDLIDIASSIPNDITRGIYINQIEQDFNISKESINQQMQQSKFKSLDTFINLSKQELKQTLKLIEVEQDTSLKNR